MRQPLRQLADQLGYGFRDEGLLERALTHRSAGADHNERFEFLGDAILGFVVANALFEKFASATEGQLSRLRAALVKKDTLAEVARSLRLGDYLNLGPGELRTGGHARASILADALEALFAAVYLDGGADESRRVILALFQPRIDTMTPESGRKDAETRLQEHLQGQRLALPTYEIVAIEGADHAQRFRCRCTVDELGLEAIGEGTSRRLAEQDAAAGILRRLKNAD